MANINALLSNLSVPLSQSQLIVTVLHSKPFKINQPYVVTTVTTTWSTSFFKRHLSVGAEAVQRVS